MVKFSPKAKSVLLVMMISMLLSSSWAFNNGALHVLNVDLRVPVQVSVSVHRAHSHSAEKFLLEPTAEPTQEQVRKSRAPGKRRNSFSRARKKPRKIARSSDDVRNSSRWTQAEQVEKKILTALELMKERIQGKETPPISFPSVRDCNAAMATFGDAENFLRALGLFLKMRKATTMAPKSCRFLVPVPSLVTYSTLMSRAVKVGKERLALRLWYLMKTQARFFSSTQSEQIRDSVIVPDVKAANILMNVHAKLCDVESAKYLMSQMVYGNGTDVPKLKPNIVTYNSLLDACQKAGDLDAALEAKQQLDMSGLCPDARTYTTLISTVGRKASTASGAKDPSMAFTFLSEMVLLNVRPNGMTYSALIDTCDRCGRTDMALKGLRTMLRQKSKEQRGMKKRDREKHSLFNEVGAWTAAINALGRAGRVETALRLFHSMSKSGVQPNTITYGCLTDCLLRNGRTTDALNVLVHMKRKGMAPSEVMYTSLMTSAGRMAKNENMQRWNGPFAFEEDLLSDDDTTAIEVYTTLMKTLLEDSKDTENTQLMKVFLVFQEMKAAGAEPDLACYNAMLRACAHAGDMTHVKDVLQRIKEDGLVPSDTTWREALRTAAKARRADFAEAIWAKGLEFDQDRTLKQPWKPSVDSFSNLLAAYLREAKDKRGDTQAQSELYTKVITMYKDIMTGSSKRKIDKENLIESTRALGMILQAMVALYFVTDDSKHKLLLQRVAVSVASLDVWRKQEHVEGAIWSKTLEIAEQWRKEIAR